MCGVQGERGPYNEWRAEFSREVQRYKPKKKKVTARKLYTSYVNKLHVHACTCRWNTGTLVCFLVSELKTNNTSDQKAIVFVCTHCNAPDRL